MTATKTAPKAVHARDSLGGYKSGDYGAELVLAPAKIGKTVTIVGNLLGVMPWQDHGGVVDKPEHLHVFTFDAVTMDGALDFYTKQCGAPPEVAKVHTINLEAATRGAFASRTEYDGTFPSLVYQKLYEVKEQVAKGGTHAVVFASLTMMAKAWLRSISGPAFTGVGMKKSPMDQNKWGLFAQQLAEFQFTAQDQTAHHTIWETHWAEKESKSKKDASGNAMVFDSIQVQGATAVQFPAQCARPYMMARRRGGWKPGSKVDLVEWDTQPNLDFGESMMAGRKVVGVLEPKEKDLTLMFHKLGLEIGGWGT